MECWVCHHTVQQVPQLELFPSFFFFFFFLLVWGLCVCVYCFFFFRYKFLLSEGEKSLSRKIIIVRLQVLWSP